MSLPANPWQSLWKRLPAPLQNRYYLTLVIFFFILFFLDKHDVWTQFKLQRAVNKLESDKAYYKEKIEEAKEEAEDFELTKEKYAREHYFMRQSNEDVYIIKKDR
ncbi:MAG: hypothetical protein IPL65_12640 [Lewinellaceae bacterium]|nr:hypothetical protein [Lewinellaceae bacterium]